MAHLLTASAGAVVVLEVQVILEDHIQDLEEKVELVPALILLVLIIP